MSLPVNPKAVNRAMMVAKNLANRISPGSGDVSLPLAGQPVSLQRARGGGAKEPPKAYFEVAPGRTWDPEQQEKWEGLHLSTKALVSNKMIREFMGPWQRQAGVKGKVSLGLGGFEGNSNPNYTFSPENPHHIGRALHGLGNLFPQDAMMGVSDEPFSGSSPSGVVRIHLPERVHPDRAHAIYEHLHRFGLAQGHSTDPQTGYMDILSGNSGRETQENAKKIDNLLNNIYPVSSYDAHVAFPEHGADYGLPGTQSSGVSAPLQGWEDHLRGAASSRFGKILQEAHRQGGGHQGQVNLDGFAKGGSVGKQTVTNPTGNRYPGIYDDPREIAAKAAARVAPESPNLKRLFGVTRAEMYEQGAHRQGNMEPALNFKGGNRISAAAEGVMNPRNARRLQDVLGEAQQYEGLKHGMMPWYYMDPAFHRLKEMLGHDAAVKRYSRFNAMSGMASPGSEVPTELNRGLAADYLTEHNRFKDFVQYGGGTKPGRPADMAHVMGHPYHSTSQAGPMERYLKTGDLSDMQSVKVPTYIPASGVPETGFQTRWPVPDAHLTRFVGMADTRGGVDPKHSMLPPEYKHFAPWFREKVAKKMGMEAVPAQALLWGAGSHATGVTTPIGSPKLELLADHMAEVAHRHGVSPETARDGVLTGTMFNTGGVVDEALAISRKKR